MSAGRARVAARARVGALAIALLLACPTLARADAVADSVTVLRALLKAHRPAEAESRSRALVAELDARGAADSTRARALDVLVLAILDAGKSNQPGSRAVADRAVRLNETAYGPDSPQAGVALISLARLLYRAGDNQGARAPAERGLVLCERGFGEHHIAVVRGLHYLANIYEEAAEFDTAERVYRREVALAREVMGPESAELGNALNSIGVLYRKTGRLTQARASYEQALAIREKALGSEHPDLAINLSNLGNVLTELGDVRRARVLYERALAISVKGYGEEHPASTMVLGNLANAELQTGDTTRALAHYRRVVKLIEKIQGADHPELAFALTDEGQLLTARGEFGAARPVLERALKIREHAFGSDNPHVATTLEALGELELAQGDAAAATPRFERALTIRERTLGPAHRDVAETLAGLARARYAAGDDSAAFEATLRAERIATDHLRLTARVLEERVALEYAATRPSGLDLALSIAALSSDPRRVAQAWDALIHSRALVLDEMARRHRRVASSGDSLVARLADSLEATSARVASLLSRGSSAGASPAERGALESAERNRERIEFHLAQRSASFRADERASVARYEDVRAALADEEALVAFAFYRAAPRAAGSAPEGRYLAFVLPVHHGPPRVIALGVAAHVDSAVAAWAAEAARRPSALARARDESRCRAAGARLAKLVWEPLQSALAGSTRVLVVPDGSIQLVNFAALPAPRGGFLAERGPVLHTLSSERDAVRLDDGLPSGRGLLALGAPDFDRLPDDPAGSNGLERERNSSRAAPALTRGAALRPPRPDASSESPGGVPVDKRSAESGCEDFRSLEFEALPGARIEAAIVASLWREATRTGGSPGAAAGGTRADVGSDARGARDDGALELTGARATESAFRRLAPGRRVLHLATHGFLLGNGCGVRGARGRAPASADDSVAFENPLLRSGIALAGANRRALAPPGHDDGILTAQEIATYDLSGVEWAVLSACETGRGEIRSGEGVLGLRRGFQIAGVRTIIMSLWSVDDESTRQWMRRLYDARLRRRLPSAEAVRSASLEILRSRRAKGESDHPFYWAGFVAAGEWR